MSTLSLTLYPEGPSDSRFLSILIQKTAQQILNDYANTIIEVLPVEVVKVTKREGGKDILEAALNSFNMNLKASPCL